MIERYTDASPFPATKWSLVARSRDKNSAVRARALEELCERYWVPIYAYARRLGHTPADSEDLTQGFYLMMLNRRDFSRADRDRGKFRAYVRTAFQNFVKDHYKAIRAQKRGGNVRMISIDQDAGENLYRDLKSGEQLTPERVFDRHFAVALLERALQRLREVYDNSERPERFDLLRPYLDGDGAPAYADLAIMLQKSESATKSTIYRFRGQFRRILLSEVEETIGPERDAESELKYLLSLFN